MNPLQQIADNLAALNSDAPERADAVIKLTNMAASQGVVDEAMVERACAAAYPGWPTARPEGERARIRAALQAAALPASNNADTLSQALHELRTVLYSGDWHMPDDTHAQLEGIYEDAKNGIGTGFIDAALPAVPDGMVLVQRIDAQRIAEYVTDENTPGDSPAADLSARRVLALLAATPAQPAAPPDDDNMVVIETVGFVRENAEGDRYIDWTIEGGIHELEIGEVINVSSQRVTNDEGYGELYRRPQPALPAVPEGEKWHITEAWVHGGTVAELKLQRRFRGEDKAEVTDLCGQYVRLAATPAHDQPEGGAS